MSSISELDMNCANPEYWQPRCAHCGMALLAAGFACLGCPGRRRSIPEQREYIEAGERLAAKRNLSIQQEVM